MKNLMWGCALLVMTAPTLSNAQTAGAKSPWSGTWRIVPEKSSKAAPSSATVRIEDVADGIRVISDSTNAAGAKNHTEYTAKFDGLEVPVTGAPGATVAVMRAGARAFDVVIRNKGATTYGHDEISADGHTRTVTQKLVLGGRESMMTLVYERVP